MGDRCYAECAEARFAYPLFRPHQLPAESTHRGMLQQGIPTTTVSRPGNTRPIGPNIRDQVRQTSVEPPGECWDTPTCRPLASGPISDPRNQSICKEHLRPIDDTRGMVRIGPKAQHGPLVAPHLQEGDRRVGLTRRWACGSPPSLWALGAGVRAGAAGRYG